MFWKIIEFVIIYILLAGATQFCIYFFVAKNAPTLKELGLPEECGARNKPSCKDCLAWKKFKETANG